MIKRYFCLFLLVLFWSCSSTNSCGLNRRDLEEYFVGSGVVRYFLPNLPDWANYSPAGACHRDVSARYFDLDKLRSSLSLSYMQAVQFQFMFNVEYEKILFRTKADYMPFKEEEGLFYNISDKIHSNIFYFQIPEFKRINLIWIDPAIANSKEEESLKMLLKHQDMDYGVPIFVSLCLGNREMKEYLQHKQFYHRQSNILSFEMFSIFDPSGEKHPHLYLDFSQLFSAEQELHLYIRGPKVPINFGGNFKAVHHY